MLEKTLHFVWVGDMDKCPDNFINTWKHFHKNWTIKIWTNTDLHNKDWINKKHMQDLWEAKSYCGIADLMRYEILLEHGGFAVDADFICVDTIPDWILTTNFVASYENEIARPGLIANGFMGALKQSPLLEKLIMEINRKKSVIYEYKLGGLIRRKKRVWKMTGPAALTECLKNATEVTRLPSHFFLPEHFTGIKYTGVGPVYSYQIWSTTKGGTGLDSKAEAEQLILWAKEQLDKNRVM